MAGEKKNLKSTKVVETPKVVETKKKTKKVVAEPTIATPEPIVAAVEPVEPVAAVAVVVDSKKKATKKTTKKTVEPVVAAVEPIVTTVEPVVVAAVEPVVVVAKPRSKKVTLKKTVSKKGAAKRVATKKAIKKVNTNVEADVDAEVEDQKNTKKTGNERYFKILDGENRTGRFKGTKPKQAACKAFTAIVKSLGDKYVLGTTIPFTIVECTRRSSNKEYNYNGRKAELDTPHQVEIKKENNETSYITYKYKNYIKKDKVIVA